MTSKMETENWLEILRHKFMILATIENKEERQQDGYKLARKMQKCINLMEEFILIPGTEEYKMFYAFAIESLHKTINVIEQYIQNE